MLGYTAEQSQKVVSAYFTSKQILPFGFVEQYTCIRTPYGIIYSTCSRCITEKTVIYP